MSYTTKGAPQGIPSNETNLLQEAMIGELVAINDYAEHISSSNIAEINHLWEHIMEDEKRHYGMLLELLRRYDSTQMHKHEEAINHVKLRGNKLNDFSSTHYDKNLILNKVRSDIKGELEAIILYEHHVIQINLRDVKKVLLEIIGDEKEHVEELTLLLQHYDPHSYGPLD